MEHLIFLLKVIKWFKKLYKFVSFRKKYSLVHFFNMGSHIYPTQHVFPCPLVYIHITYRFQILCGMHSKFESENHHGNFWVLKKLRSFIHTHHIVSLQEKQIEEIEK